MSDILIRDVDPITLRRIDYEAARAGVSRSAYLRAALDKLAASLDNVSMEDLRDSAALAQGVLDTDLMQQAWE